MGYITIYHGSEAIVEKPIYHYAGSNSNNDYGLGFYCSKDIDMAKEWANRATRNGYVNKYYFDERGLTILDLSDKTKYGVLNWIAILLHNRKINDEDRVEFDDVLSFLERYYIDIEKYDVVIGYRADDAYFRFPMMFFKNVLTCEKLEEIYNLGSLGKQYVLISKKAFSRIKFDKATLVEDIFYERFHRRIIGADNSYRELERLERNAKGTRVRDLMNQHD